MNTLLMADGYVEFPNLFSDTGIRIPVNEVAFTLFGFEVRWYGVIICLGVILCVTLALLACRKYDIDANDLLDYMIISIPCAILGARLYYVAFNFEYYWENPSQILNYWQGGLAVLGGVIAAVIAALFVARHKKQSWLKILDFAVPYILLGQAIGRWGNFVNQEAYGTATTLPWGMTGDQIAEEIKFLGYKTGTLVHPTFLYESLWCLIAFILVMLYRRSKLKKANGEVVCLYMILYGAERALVEGLRTDSLYIGSEIRVSQLLSIIMVIVGIALFIDLRRRWSKKQYEEGAPDADSGLSNVVQTIIGEQSDSQAEVEAAVLADAREQELQAYDADSVAEDISGEEGQTDDK